MTTPCVPTMAWCVQTENKRCFGYLRLGRCKPDYLFRGTRLADGKKVVIKAVHFCSRECDVIRILSSPPLRDDPMNHTIRLSFFSPITNPRLAADGHQLF